MAPKNKIPDGWEASSKYGSVIPGTRIFAFKVPLKDSFRNKIRDHRNVFTPDDLVREQPDLGLVIDLTATDKYYDSYELRARDIDHVKISSPGVGHLPPPDNFRLFFIAVDRFLTENRDNNKLIGVHCTHGINRSGYFICKYLIDKCGWDADEAIEKFETARGHRIERDSYLTALRN